MTKCHKFEVSKWQSYERTIIKNRFGNLTQNCDGFTR